jgi:hypothetical protein
MKEHLKSEKKVYNISQTSLDAYNSVNRGDDTLYGAVIEALEMASFCDLDEGLTCDEIEVMLEARHQSVSSRIRHGVKNDLVINSGKKRKTRSGRNAIVWTIIREDDGEETQD